MILVDSDVLIEHLRGNTAARDWLVSARQSSGPLAISVVSLTEIAHAALRDLQARATTLGADSGHELLAQPASPK